MPTNLWLGMALIVPVGGIALGLSLSAFTRDCASTASMLPLGSSASCADRFVTGAEEALLAIAAFVLGALFLVRARIPPLHRVPVAAGILVAVVLLVASVPAFVPPPAPTVGVRPQLDFPMSAGTTFEATPGAFDAFAEAAIPADPYVPWALIELQGGWNSTAPVCLSVVRTSGPALGPGLGAVCGTAVTFVFILDATTYVFAFYLPPGDGTAVRAQVVITSDVHIVY